MTWCISQKMKTQIFIKYINKQTANRAITFKLKM